MGGTVLKNTKSVSPITCKDIDAQVVCEDGKVYLVKKDEKGNIHKGLIEKDVEFYKRLTKYSVKEQVPYSVYQMYISADCNLNCQICYEDTNRLQEVSLEQVREILSKIEKKGIGLIGREPTCRKELPQIIRMCIEKNYPVLITNGIRLANYEYAKELRDSGLITVFFSLNGFSDKCNEQIDGRSTINIKLKALENLKKLKQLTLISVTLARGVNEDQVKPIFEYCLDNRSFVGELRFRTVSPVGRYKVKEFYCMSDMINVIAQQLGVEKDDIMKEFTFWDEFFEATKGFIPPTARHYFAVRLCSFFFHVKKFKDKIIPLGMRINVDRITKSKLKRLWLVFYLFKTFGPVFVFERIYLALGSPLARAKAIPRDRSMLRVVLRCWPNIDNIDLEENKKCTSLYYKGGKAHTFCYHNIIGSGSCPK